MTHRRDGTHRGVEVARIASRVGRLAGVATGAVGGEGHRVRVVIHRTGAVKQSVTVGCRDFDH